MSHSDGKSSPNSSSRPRSCGVIVSRASTRSASCRFSSASRDNAVFQRLSNSPATRRFAGSTRSYWRLARSTSYRACWRANASDWRFCAVGRQPAQGHRGPLARRPAGPPPRAAGKQPRRRGQLPTTGTPPNHDRPVRPDRYSVLVYPLGHCNPRTFVDCSARSVAVLITALHPIWQRPRFLPSASPNSPPTSQDSIENSPSQCTPRDCRVSALSIAREVFAVVPLVGRVRPRQRSLPPCVRMPARPHKSDWSGSGESGSPLARPIPHHGQTWQAPRSERICSRRDTRASFGGHPKFTKLAEYAGHRLLDTAVGRLLHAVIVGAHKTRRNLPQGVSTFHFLLERATCRVAGTATTQIRSWCLAIREAIDR